MFAPLVFVHQDEIVVGAVYGKHGIVERLCKATPHAVASVRACIFVTGALRINDAYNKDVLLFCNLDNLP